MSITIIKLQILIKFEKLRTEIQLNESADKQSDL